MKKAQRQKNLSEQKHESSFPFFRDDFDALKTNEYKVLILDDYYKTLAFDLSRVLALGDVTPIPPVNDFILLLQPISSSSTSWNDLCIPLTILMRLKNNQTLALSKVTRIFTSDQFTSANPNNNLQSQSNKPKKTTQNAPYQNSKLKIQETP